MSRLALKIMAGRRQMAGGSHWCTVALAVVGWLGGSISSQSATIVVTNLANSGAGSLRAALTNAHNGDVITFAVTGVITNRGELTVSNSVNIAGPGADLLTVIGTNWYRGLRIISGVTSSVSGLTFSNCYGGLDGGGIYNGGNLTLSNCVFTDCKSQSGGISLNNGGSGFAAGNGGAIFNSNMLVAVNCQFLNNVASAGGYGATGVFSPGESVSAGGNGGNGGSGGAVYDIGNASFTNCTFAGNSSGAGGAGGQGGSGSSSPFPPTLFSGPGRSGGNGGHAGNGSAVFSLSGPKFVSCTFFNNTAGNGGNGGNGGDAYLNNVNANYSGGKGGNAGNAGGGALYCAGPAQLVACTFANNTAGTGGVGGSGGNGANNFNGGPGGNGANGGNAGNGGSGGGICGPVTNATFTLQNVLIAQNTPGYAGSAGPAGAGGSGVVFGSNGQPGTNAVDGIGPDLSGKFISQKYNLIGLSDGSTGFTNSLLNDIVGTGTPVDPMISAVNNNGGLVGTCALLPVSPAMDAGDDTLIGAPSNLMTDARSYPRKAGAHVDIGAYEYQLVTLPIVSRTAVTVDGVRVSCTNTPGVAFTVLGTTDFTLPIDNWDILGQMTEIAPGQFQWVDPDYPSYDFRFFRLRSP